MGTSTLTPENLPAGPDRRIHQGHGTAALGPSDSSDSGSDIAGVGRYLGDSDLDSDTDSTGTGERGAVGRDKAARDGSDIDVDHIERIAGEEEEGD